jgi:hypothetical protein
MGLCISFKKKKRIHQLLWNTVVLWTLETKHSQNEHISLWKITVRVTAPQVTIFQGNRYWWLPAGYRMTNPVISMHQIHTQSLTVA